MSCQLEETFVTGLVKADLDVRALFEVHRIDEAHLAVVEGQDHGRGAHAFAEETHAFEEIAVGYASAGKMILLPGARSSVS